MAHIERYHCLENDEKKVQELINMGCYTQINSSSVLKPKLLRDSHKFMKKRAQFFLEKDLVQLCCQRHAQSKSETALYEGGL